MPIASVRLGVRARRAYALTGLVALGACEAEAPPPAEEAPLAFAPALGVDLAVMERSGTGLHTRVLAEGEGEPAAEGAPMAVEYEGFLPDGTRFDASAPGQPLQVVLGETGLIPGFTEGLRGLRPGGSRLLVIPPELAYGDRGVPGAIPGGATLVFRIRRVDGIGAEPAGPAAPQGPEAG